MPEPDEPGQAAVNRVLKQCQIAPPELGSDPAGNPGFYPALSLHKCIRAKPFEGRDCRQNGVGLPALLDKPAGKILVGPRQFGFLVEPAAEVSCLVAGKGSKPVQIPQFCKMLMAGLFPNRVVEKIITIETKLLTDEIHHVLRNQFVRCQNPSRLSRGTMLQSKSELVVRPATPPDMLQVYFTRDIILQELRFCSRQ